MKVIGLLMGFPRVAIVLHLLCFGFVAGLWGCATKNSQGDIVKQYEYRRALDREKQEALMAAEEEASKKNPEMTAEGYEQLGDFYLWQGNMEMAFFQYKKALGRDAKRTGIRYKIGHLFLEKGLVKEAEA